MKKIAVIILCGIIAISVSAAGVIFAPAANSTALAATTATDFETYLYLGDPNHKIASGATVNKQVGLYFTKYNTKTLISAKNTQGPIINYSITNNRVEFPIVNSATYVVIVAATEFTPQQEIFVFTYDTESPSVSGYTSRIAIQSGDVIIGNAITVEAHDNLRDVQLYVAIDNGDPALCSGVTYKITADGTYTFYAVDKAGNYSEDFTVTYYSTAPPEPEPEPNEPEPNEPAEPDIPPAQDEEREESEKSNGGIIAVAVIAAIAVVAAITIIVIKKVRENKIVAND